MRARAEGDSVWALRQFPEVVLRLGDTSGISLSLCHLRGTPLILLWIFIVQYLAFLSSLPPPFSHPWECWGRGASPGPP